jgi:hypothetical protein
MHRSTAWFAVSLLEIVASAAAQDANITQPVEQLERLFAAEPLSIEQAEISRPKAAGDITLRAEVSFGGAPPLRVKLRRAEPGAEVFNNVPRYDLAAYELQKLFLDREEYVVPPTTLRMVPRADFAKFAPEVERTFSEADQVLAVVQFWLNDVTNAADIYDAARFGADALYARHIGQLNLLTWLIEHRDSNIGNFLIGRTTEGPRVFSIDHGVAFASEDSDRGELWKVLRVKRFPADAVERLRLVTPALLAQRLGVLAEWRLENGRYVPVTASENLVPGRGVRRRDGVLQMGLSQAEITQVHRQLTRFLSQAERGRFELVARSSP